MRLWVDCKLWGEIMIEIKDKGNSKEVDAEWIVLMEEAFLQGLTPRETREFLQERSDNGT